MGFQGEHVAYGLIVASYRRRMGVIAVGAGDGYRQSQYAGLTRLQLDEVGRERQVQRQGARRAEALAEGSVELTQAMVPVQGQGGCSLCSRKQRDDFGQEASTFAK
jgi:hypothetical protein